MASATEEFLPRAHDVLKPINDDTDMSVEKGRTPGHPPLERAPSRPSPTDPALVDADITYPEGGLQAWLVVLGAFCGLTASLGIYNSTGVFEAYISREILSEESPSTVGWIFGIYSFMTFFGGVQVGPTFDAKGPRGLLIAGSVCTLVGIFVLSICTGEMIFMQCSTAGLTRESPARIGYPVPPLSRLKPILV